MDGLSTQMPDAHAAQVKSWGKKNWYEFGQNLGKLMQARCRRNALHKGVEGSSVSFLSLRNHGEARARLMTCGKNL